LSNLPCASASPDYRGVPLLGLKGTTTVSHLTDRQWTGLSDDVDKIAMSSSHIDCSLIPWRSRGWQGGSSMKLGSAPGGTGLQQASKCCLGLQTFEPWFITNGYRRSTVFSYW